MALLQGKDYGFEALLQEDIYILVKSLEEPLEKFWKIFLFFGFVRMHMTTLRHWLKMRQRWSVVDFPNIKICERRTWKLVNAHLLHPVLFCFALSIPTINDAAVVVTSVSDDITHLELDRHCLVGPPYLSAGRFIGPLEPTKHGFQQRRSTTMISVVL